MLPFSSIKKRTARVEITTPKCDIWQDGLRSSAACPTLGRIAIKKRETSHHKALVPFSDAKSASAQLRFVLVHLGGLLFSSSSAEHFFMSFRVTRQVSLYVVVVSNSIKRRKKASRMTKWARRKANCVGRRWSQLSDVGQNGKITKGAGSKISKSIRPQLQCCKRSSS